MACAPKRLKMRIASAGETPCCWRKIMMAPTARCFSQAFATAAARCGPSPGTSARRSGARSSTSSVERPKASTMRLA